MALKSDKHPCVILALIASMPKVFEAVQDKCITKANCKKDSKSFYIKYNFEYYQYSREKINKQRELLKDEKWNPPPLSTVNAMVAHGRVELLAHPLSQKYLQMKWNSYGKYFHLLNLLLYTIFLALVTSFSAQLMDETWIRRNYTTNTTRPHFTIEVGVPNAAMYICAVSILTYIGLSSMREIFQLYQQRWRYLLDPSNFVSWLLYAAATMMVIPVFSGNFDDLQLSCASITVFLSWFNLLLYLQRFDQVGIYVVMFLEILQTLIKVLVVFSILIIAFGLAFYILLSEGAHLSFKNVPMSLMRTFSMMLGEIDFLGTYVRPYYLNEETFLPYPLPTFVILGLFMVLMPILLMNLLIGLAVGDIESVRRNAQLKRLAMQVVLHTELERKLPHMLLDKVDKTEIIEYPNESKCKIGFLDSVLRKWFCSPFSQDGLEMVLENNDDYMTEELNKQKKRLKEIASALETQHLLLRLIVQKMEIKTEADDVDEGVSPNELRPLLGVASKWTSPRVRKKLRSALSFSKSSST